MSLFVEVNSVAPKNCRLIVNLDYVLEVAPLLSGGCVITIGAAEAGTSRVITVSDNYDSFMQFVMSTVTVDSIQNRFPKTKKEVNPAIKAQGNSGVELDIPSFGAK